MAIQRLAAGRSSSRSGSILLQRKLTIGSVDDPLEHEADRAAEHVMRMPAPVGPIESAAPQVQRKCACGGTCDSCRTDEEQWMVQRKSAGHPPIGAAGASASTSMNAPPIVHDVLRSPGQPLDAGTRSFMEPRFGQDFSTVRVHTGPKAAESAAAVQARAYTVGNNIVFGGKESASDLPILAHELTHVVQQSGGSHRLQRLEACADFLEFMPNTGVPESRVRDSLADDAELLGTVATELHIPAGSYDPYRTEPRRGRSDQEIPPQIIDLIRRALGEGPVQGDGRADVGLLNGSTLEVIEVKEASWSGGLEAEEQLANYLEKADAFPDVVNEFWASKTGSTDEIDSVRAMPMTRLNLFPNPRPFGTELVSLRWCRDGIIVFKVEEEEEPEEEPEQEPPEQEPQQQGPGSSPSEPLEELLKELGAEMAKLLATDYLLSAALSFVGSFAALAPFILLAGLAFGIVYFWDEIKSIAQWIGGAIEAVLDKIGSVVATIGGLIKKLGIKLADLAEFLGGLFEDLVEAIADGLLAAGRAAISGAKRLGGWIAEGAEALWDWLTGDDVEAMAPNIDLPITEEPTTHCGTVAREDALIQIDSDILFPFGEWELTKMTPEGHAALIAAAARVLFTPRTSDDPVRFFGFTDVIGGPVKNQELSEKRAKAVADWFVGLGVVPKEKVEITGLGETEAKAAANDEEGRKKDRRVDILVTKKGSTEKVCW